MEDQDGETGATHHHAVDPLVCHVETVTHVQLLAAEITTFIIHSSHHNIVLPILWQVVQYPVILDSLINREFRIMGGVYDNFLLNG